MQSLYNAIERIQLIMPAPYKVLVTWPAICTFRLKVLADAVFI